MLDKKIGDEKKHRIFFKAITRIQVAAQIGGPDPNLNPKLKLAILLAKAANVPKLKIENAISAKSSSNKADYKETRFEGYVNSVAVLVETLTDNYGKTLFEVKKTFHRSGGSLAEVGSVAHGFDHLGFITYPKDVKSEDEMLEIALEAGAEDCQLIENEYQISSKYDHLHKVKDELEKKLGEPKAAKLIWKPKSTVALDDAKTKSVLQMIDNLEEMPEVQDVWTNLEIPEALRVREE